MPRKPIPRPPGAAMNKSVRPRQMPKIADPFAFRQRSRPPDQIANLCGDPVAVDWYRLRGEWHCTPRTDAPSKKILDEANARRTLVELRRRRAKLLAKCRMTPGLSEVDLSLIEGILYGSTLNSWAKSHDVTREAARQRFQRIMVRLPFLRSVWRRLHPYRSQARSF